MEAPEWVSTDKYDIVGVADVPGEPDLKQMQAMYRKLFVERFGMVVRQEKREMTYYAITVAKGGVKLAATKFQESDLDQTGNGHGGQMEMKYVANQMSDFALGMNYFADRPVVDETGLVGRYDFTLKWTPDSLRVAEGEQAPGLFTAVVEQLGLKLEAKKGSVEVLAVEKVGRPSEN